MRSAADPRAAGDVELGVLDGAHVLDERAGEDGDERVRLRARRGGDSDAAGARALWVCNYCLHLCKQVEAARSDAGYACGR